MKVKVHVTLKNGVLDPQGKAVGHALEGLGFSGVDGVRIGRYIEFDLEDVYDVVSVFDEIRSAGGALSCLQVFCLPQPGLCCKHRL